MIAFREVENPDMESIVTLWKRCGLLRALNDPVRDIALAAKSENSTILVGVAHGTIVASVMVGHDGHRGAIYYLAADPGFQKRGYGKAAMAAAEDWLRNRGVWKVNLMVRTENKSVGGFYEALGYAINPVVSYAKRID
jgi:ribosomal protein S18 acetylase RimI-like enzyme